jgi:hypothetical protein
VIDVTPVEPSMSSVAAADVETTNFSTAVEAGVAFAFMTTFIVSVPAPPEIESKDVNV